MLMDARKRRHKRTAGGFGVLGFSGGDGAVWIQTTRVRTVAAPFRGKFKTDCEKRRKTFTLSLSRSNCLVPRRVLQDLMGGRVVEWLEALTCNPEVPSSSLLSDHREIVLFTVVPCAKPRSRL